MFNGAWIALHLHASSETHTHHLSLGFIVIVDAVAAAAAAAAAEMMLDIAIIQKVLTTTTYTTSPLPPPPPVAAAATTKLWFYQEKGIKIDLSSSNKCICSQNHLSRMAELWNFALTWASLSFSNEVFSLCSPLNLKDLSRRDRIRCFPLLHMN